MSRDAALAGEIAALHGLRPDRIASVEGGGSVNRVFVVHSEGPRFAVRFPIDPLRKDEFEVEAWCLTRAAAHGIPSPRVIARGEVREIPYLIQSFVEGVPGASGGSDDPWKWLARYARTMHTIDITHDAPDGLFSRFGRDLPAAWRAHLAYNLEQLVETDPLLRLAVYRPDQQTRLRSAIERLGDVELDFGLCHGDLSPRNLIFPRSGPPVLIDWGTAAVGPVPYGDLLPVVKAHHATGEPSYTELPAFAETLGRSLPEGRHTLDDLMLLEALDLVRWAIDQRPGPRRRDRTVLPRSDPEPVRVVVGCLPEVAFGFALRDTSTGHCSCTCRRCRRIRGGLW